MEKLIGVSKERVNSIQVLARISKLGELDHVLFMFLNNCMNHSMFVYDFPLLYLKSCVSGIFPETTWRMRNCRQATHTIYVCFLGLYEEPPDGELCAAGQHKLRNPVPGFSYERPSSDESAKRRESFWLNFGVLGRLGWFWSGNLEAIYVKWVSDFIYCWMRWSLEVNLMKLSWNWV